VAREVPGFGGPNIKRERILPFPASLLFFSLSPFASSHHPLRAPLSACFAFPLICAHLLSSLFPLAESSPLPSSVRRTRRYRANSRAAAARRMLSNTLTENHTQVAPNGPVPHPLTNPQTVPEQPVYGHRSPQLRRRSGPGGFKPHCRRRQQCATIKWFYARSVLRPRRCGLPMQPVHIRLFGFRRLTGPGTSFRHI